MLVTRNCFMNKKLGYRKSICSLCEIHTCKRSIEQIFVTQFWITRRIEIIRLRTLRTNDKQRGCCKNEASGTPFHRRFSSYEFSNASFRCHVGLLINHPTCWLLSNFNMFHWRYQRFFSVMNDSEANLVVSFIMLHVVSPLRERKRKREKSVVRWFWQPSRTWSKV
jgi:hypothetical protein